MMMVRTRRSNPFRQPSAAVSIALLGSALLLPACTEMDMEDVETIASQSDYSPEINAAIDATPQIRHGYAVYSRNCVGCHGVKGDGEGVAAKYFTTKPRDFTAGKYKFRSTPNGQLPLDEDLDRTLRQGLADTPMPSFEFMPKRDRDAVIAFIKLYSSDWTDASKTPERVFLPDFEPTDLLTEERVLRGRFGYVAMGCASCHGMTGRGNGPSAHALKDDWDNPVLPYNYHQGAPKGGSTALDVYRTFRTGVTPMPMYQGDTLGLVTRDLKGMVFARLVEQEQILLAPVIESLPTMAEVNGWKETDPERAEQYADDRAWDLVAYTIWLREASKPERAAIWPEGSDAFTETMTPVDQ